MELQQVQAEIEKRIRLLEIGRNELKNRAQRKADTIAEYEKVIAKTILRLHNGECIELDGVRVKDPPATTTEKIARGICWKARLDMELADAEYRNATKGMDSIMAELNGWQSINRHQSEH